MSPTQLEKVWRRIRERVGLPTLRIHDLRHGFASVALSSGEALRTVSGLLGHSDLQTTAGYAQFAEAPVRDAAKRVADHIGKALATNATEAVPVADGMVASFLAQGLSIKAFAEAEGIRPATLRQKLSRHFIKVRDAREDPSS